MALRVVRELPQLDYLPPPGTLVLGKELFGNRIGGNMSKAKWVSILAYLIWSSHAIAEPVPSGCYVTDEERYLYSGSYSCTDCTPPACYETSDGFYSWFTPAQADVSTLLSQYGSLTATLIIDGYNTSEEYTALSRQYRRALRLNNRLRRACGSRCNSIR